MRHQAQGKRSGEAITSILLGALLLVTHCTVNWKGHNPEFMSDFLEESDSKTSVSQVDISVITA